MPSGVKDLRIYQIGRETTKGTLVAATNRLVGQLRVNPRIEVRMPEPQVGLLIDHPVSDTIVRDYVEAEFSGDLSYEQILYILNAALKGLTTGTGAGPDKTWTFNPIYTGDNALNTFTFQRRLTDGSTSWDERFGYGLCEDFELSGNVGEIAQFRSNWFGRAIDTAATLTPSIPVPAVNFVSCADIKLYINDTFAALGTTQVNKLVSWRLGCRGQYQSKFYQEGRTDRSFGDHSIKRMGYDFSATVEWDAVVNAERAKAKSRAIRYVRLEAVGPTLGGSNYKITVDMACRYEEGMFDEAGDRDGNDTTELRLVDAYDTTNLIGIKFVVVNALASLP